MAGYLKTNSHRCTTFLLFLFCMLLVSLLWGCGGGTSEPESSEKVSTASTDTGSASFAIQWHTATADQASAVVRQAIGSCETAGVASITCQVYDDQSQNPIASGGPWNCLDHHGTIEQIPAGANRVFAVLGWSDADGGGNAIYQGQIGSITITPGQTTHAGTIDARPFVPASPIIGDVYGNQINLSWNDMGFGTYRIYRDGVAVGDSNTTTYSDTGLTQQTQYSYTISALDGFGNESARSGQTNATTTLVSIWYRDSDDDLYGDPENSITDTSTSPPEGYVADNTDCNDEIPAVHPGADEICNGIDDDCDESTDEGVLNTYYSDNDHDTYGDAGNTTQECSVPDGYVTNSSDCNDQNPNINPGINEICGDDIDQDCNGTDLSCDNVDNDGDGFSENQGDCNDADANVNPEAAEVCNGIDDNCAGGIDENLTRSTTCGVGVCAGNTGTETCSAGEWVGDTCAPFAGAGTEVCDNVDNDCDGSVDENLTRSTTCGAGACAGNTGTETCSAGNWGGDTCDPFAGAVDEVCFDGIDNDCSGVIDDDCVTANEDCIGFEPDYAYVYSNDYQWVLADRGQQMQPLYFDVYDEAYQSLDIIRYYLINSQCFVGPREDPSMEYWLVNGMSPSGAFISDLYTEDCLSHDPDELFIRQVGNQWLLTDGSEAIKMFPNFEEAQQALETIQYYGFTYHCYVGRPDPSMSYWRR